MELLISVVGEHEVEAGVGGQADIVDVKNPREGSLGANFPHVIRGVREITPSEVPVSVAIGDFPNLPRNGAAALAAAGGEAARTTAGHGKGPCAAGCGVQYVKVGLSGHATTMRPSALLSRGVPRGAAPRTLWSASWRPPTPTPGRPGRSRPSNAGRRR